MGLDITVEFTRPITKELESFLLSWGFFKSIFSTNHKYSLTLSNTGKEYKDYLLTKLEEAFTRLYQYA